MATNTTVLIVVAAIAAFVLAGMIVGVAYKTRATRRNVNRTTIREIASGLSTNPTFFKLRKGEAVLDSVRMSPRFFSTGHFRSDGVRVLSDGWRLHDRVRVPYHLTLPKR